MKKIIFIIPATLLIILIGLIIFFNTKKESTITISEGGSYKLSGKYSCITINTKEEVELILDGVNINCNDNPSINIKKSSKVNIVLKKENKIISNIDIDGAIYSKSILVFSGDGKLNIESNNDGIYSTKDITFESGKYIINSIDDAIHANGMIEINNGQFNISAHEGLEATYIKINDGILDIKALDDGINAGHKSDKYPIKIEINGGDISIIMSNNDNDDIDSNVDIIIN